MKKHILNAIIWFTFVIGVHVNIAHADRRDIVEVIRGGDIEAMEELMRAAHKDHVAGKVEASSVRFPFGTFSLSDPANRQFVLNWLEAYPESPYAHASAGWYYQGLAWRLRGTDTLRYIWPEALEGFHEYIKRAEWHGQQAFELAPDLISASDLILAVNPALKNLGEKGVDQVVASTIRLTPNRGTIYHAARSFDPRWGGRPSGVSELCDTYWDKIPSTEYASPLACVADMLITMGYDQELTREAYEVLAETNWRGVEWHRWSAFADPSFRHLAKLSPEEYLSFLEGDGINNISWISDLYDELYGDVRSQDLPSELMDRASQLMVSAKEAARVAWDWNPGDPTFVKVLANVAYHDKTPELQVDQGEILDLWGEVLRAHPFHWRHWVNAADQTIKIELSHETLLAAARMQGNAVAYSNHSAASLHWLLSDRAFATEPIRTTLTHLDADGEVVEAPKDMPQEFVCDTLRAARLSEFVCEADPSEWTCDISSLPIKAMVSALQSQAVAQNICEHERNSAIKDIIYIPQSIKVGEYLHRIAP